MPVRASVTATLLHPAARMKASSPSLPNELAQLLAKIVSTLPPETHELVLRHLPAPELARLSCVHKAFRDVWRRLRDQHPGRYGPPCVEVIYNVRRLSRLERAAAFDDGAVIRAMVLAGVDEHGAPLPQARNKSLNRLVDEALLLAANNGHDRAVQLLIGAGANVRAGGDKAVIFASARGHSDIVALLLLCDANVHADDDRALRLASKKGHVDIVALLILYGANVHAADDQALR